MIRTIASPIVPRSVHAVLIALLSFASVTSVPHEASGQSWEPLFDGLTLNGWTQPNGQPPGDGWEVVDGTLHLREGQPRGHNLVTNREFADFELVFEWKISARGNNGIKYRVNDFDGRILGLEYQLIDDIDYGGLRPTQTSASLYDLYEPQRETRLHAVGEFNRARIWVRGDVIEHWLNGRLVLRAIVGSQEWNARMAASKFNDVDGFGTTRTGRIMLTDHSDEVWYRNIFIRQLCPPASRPICGNTHPTRLGRCR